jgi:hypothetical protein
VPQLLLYIYTVSFLNKWSHCYFIG